MKTYFFSFFLLIALFLVDACGKPANTPEAVLEAFMEALLEKDFEEGAKYCAPQSMQMYQMAGSMLALLPAGGSVDNIVCTTSEDGETANCSAMVTDGSGKESSNERIRMVKIDGDWKVIMDKSK